MPKYTVLKDFRDGQTKNKDLREVGSVIELTEERATEINNFSELNYIKEVEDKKDTKEDKKETKKDKK